MTWQGISQFCSICVAFVKDPVLKGFRYLTLNNSLTKFSAKRGLQALPGLWLLARRRDIWATHCPLPAMVTATFLLDPHIAIPALSLVLVVSPGYPNATV